MKNMTHSELSRRRLTKPLRPSVGSHGEPHDAEPDDAEPHDAESNDAEPHDAEPHDAESDDAEPHGAPEADDLSSADGREDGHESDE